jgi:hypothetical protein
VERDVDPLRHRPDRAVALHLRLGGAQVQVRELAPERQDQVGLAHALPDLRRAEGADVDAHVQRVIHREHALGE